MTPRESTHQLNGLSATLTVTLDIDTLRLAEEEAQVRHTTLPEVVAQQLRVMARNRRESYEGRSPVTDALRGVITLQPDFDKRALLTDELRSKYGLPK